MKTSQTEQEKMCIESSKPLLTLSEEYKLIIGFMNTPMFSQQSHISAGNPNNTIFFNPQYYYKLMLNRLNIC